MRAAKVLALVAIWVASLAGVAVWAQGGAQTAPVQPRIVPMQPGAEGP